MYRILFVFIFLSSLAFGAINIADSHIIYTWGYGEMIYQVLEAVRIAIKNADPLVKSVLLIGFLFIVIKKILDSRVQPFAEFVKLSVISTVLFGLFLYAPNTDKNRFQIFDETTTETYIIEEIPVGIGLSFAFASKVERFFLWVMELAYSTPNSISIRNAGFGFSMESVNTLKNIKPIFLDPVWVRNMNSFIGVCLHYNAERNPMLMNTLLTSNDLYNDLLGMKAGFPISNTISAGYLEVVNGNNTRETIIPCSRLGENLQKGLEAQTEKLKQIHMAQLGLSNIDSYDEKMRGLSELFHTSHANSRNILQQVMLVHSYRDGIQNMERMYGLGAGTLATASSVAHYSFFNQNLQQGILAQKFLPLIKAYLTAIIVGLSWIIVILALLLGLNHLRIILSMYIFLIVWTPTLGLINFLNDLFLEFKFNAFQKYTDGMFGFNIAFNTEFFIAMQERASIMGYLVMLTPGLAYMLTKGSDYVISNLASGLTSPIASGARAGALDSTKQAQSTRSDIAIGEDVYSKQAGMREILGTGWSNGMATQQQTKLDELGNPMNSKVSVGYGASLQLSKDGNGNIHYTDGQSGQISMNSISSHTTQQVESASYKLAGSVGELTKEEISSVINKGLDAGVINEKSIGRSEVVKAIESLVESGEWTKQDIDKIGGSIGADGKVNVSAQSGLEIPSILKSILPFDFSAKIEGGIGASGGIRFDSSSTDTFSEKLGENKTKALENALNKQLAEKSLSSDKVSASFTDGQSSGTSASLTRAAEDGKAYSDALQISNSINSNDLSGAIKQKAEQLAMQDGLVLGVSGDMALHQRYATQAFSEMIQEASSFSSLENNIATTPNSMYNAGASGVNVDNHHKESKAEVRSFNEQTTNSFNQKSAEKIAEDYINFGLSKEKISTTIQKGANETGPLNFGPLNNFLQEKGILSDSMNAGLSDSTTVGKFVDRFTDYLTGGDTSIKGKLDGK